MNLTGLLYYLSVGSELLPPLMLLRTPSRDPGRLKVALLCLVWFAIDVVATVQGSLTHGSNLWVAYLLDPVQAIIVFWLLDGWQLSWMSRLALRLLLPIYLVAVAALTLLFESSDHFGLLTTTLTSSMLLGVVGYTMITRIRAHPSKLLDQEWVWICCGLALNFGLEAGFTPLLRRLMSQKPPGPPYLEFIRDVRFVANLVVMLLMARGMVCAERPQRPAALS